MADRPAGRPLHHAAGIGPLTKDQIFEFFRILAEDNPEPETELEYGNAYQLVVAVALSAQATDVGVNKATRRLFSEVTTPRQMLELGEEGLKEHIKTIGLFNSKAKNVIALSQMLVDDFGGEVPDSREELVKLPGVGRKTANVVLNCWFRQETFAVDTHILRVGNRTGLAKGKTPEQVEAKLEKRVPQPFRLHAHHWLILHGRYICKARRPECWRCPVEHLCSYRNKVMEQPVAKGKRVSAPSSA
ncbi:Endonuclease III [Croceibacterium atlanticum]|uniref:Endonuclease III n=1 Tax=Croceibacterium atlanticum TaxID=1267766 RepID=A0A0F7KU46_9SPHN|nr:Endonuclease III [Croceibacterium atlanticum]